MAVFRVVVPFMNYNCEYSHILGCIQNYRHLTYIEKSNYSSRGFCRILMKLAY